MARRDLVEYGAEVSPSRVADLGAPFTLDLLSGFAHRPVQFPATFGQLDYASSPVAAVRYALEIAEALERAELVVDRLLGEPGGPRDVAGLTPLKSLEAPQGERRAREAGVTSIVDAPVDRLADDFVRQAQGRPETRVTAEAAGDTAGCVAVYTDDVIHDVVGAPHGPLRGREAAQGFYEFLTANIATERMEVNRAWYGDDFCTIEHQWHGTVPGEFLGIPGDGREISFRMLHVFEFRDSRISRENVWLDGGAIAEQLTAPETPGTSTLRR